MAGSPFVPVAVRVLRPRMHLQARPHSLARIHVELLIVVHDDTEAACDSVGIGDRFVVATVQPAMRCGMSRARLALRVRHEQRMARVAEME